MVYIILEDSEFFYYVTAGFKALLLVITSIPSLFLRIRDADSCLRRFDRVAKIRLWFSTLTAIMR